MGLIPKVATPSPAFIHVDVDDLWAVAQCYGYEVAAEWAHHISRDALPRFENLFREAGVKGTFFVVGRDLQDDGYSDSMKRLLAAGHQVANHSWSHNLRFRSLSTTELSAEIDQADSLIQSKLNTRPVGFRAPGYAWSEQLLQLLATRNYTYDASLMPGPYGGIFRYMDSRLSRNRFPPGGEKTQYPLFRDTWNSLYPAPTRGSRLIEIPSATSPLARLPFQAGVCMRLGYPYFRACFEPYRWNKALPTVFLFHAADLADFSTVPYELFKNSTFFNKPVEERLTLARRFLETITAHRPVVTTEAWLSNPA